MESVASPPGTEELVAGGMEQLLSKDAGNGD